MSDQTIRVRQGKEELTLDGMDSLVSQVRAGRIGRATPVLLPGEEEWLRADKVPEVAVALGRDPWAAWDGDTDEEALDQFMPKATPPPVPTEEEVFATSLPIDDVEDLPDTALRPVEEQTPPVVRPPPNMAPPAEPKRVLPPQMERTSAKVIAFPQPDLPGTIGPHALDLQDVLRPKAAPREREPGKRWPVRWGMIVVIGVLGTGLMLTWVWYVNTVSTADFTARPQIQAPPPVPTALTELEPADEQESPYEVLEDELRNQLMEGLLDIGGEMEFEDALLIELRRVQLNVIAVRVGIGTWAGRNKDLPDDVSFRVKLRTSADRLDRDLGAVGLVLGKYIQHYGINATSLEVLLEDEEGTLRKVPMRPETARRFFTHRLSLEEFLSAAFSR